MLKLSLVGRRINAIDRLDERCCCVEQLLLSNNWLGDLSGLEELRRLRQLSLASNRLPSTSAVLPVLARLPELRALSLEGNPLEEAEPGYRSAIVLGLPRLETLDGRQISREERADAVAAAALRPAAAKFAALQARHLQELTRGLARLRIKQELLALAHSGPAVFRRDAQPPEPAFAAEGYGVDEGVAEPLSAEEECRIRPNRLLRLIQGTRFPASSIAQPRGTTMRDTAAGRRGTLVP